MLFQGNITPTLMSPRNGRNMDSSFPEPIGKGRSNSMSSSHGGSMSGSMPNSDHLTGPYRMAPGSEREDNHVSLISDNLNKVFENSSIL